MTQTAIGTLRLRGCSEYTPALGLRAGRQLRGADLTVPGLAPAALLFVRRLEGPRDGRFGGEGLRPPPAWEKAVQERLAEAARHAVRPDDSGALPADTEAVLFADESELLASLVLDRVRHTAGASWWRRHLDLVLEGVERAVHLAGSDPAPLLVARPRRLPAVLSRIEGWRQSLAVARALSPEGASTVLAALVRAHALPAELAVPTSQVDPSSGREPHLRSSPDSLGAPEAWSHRAAGPPWQRWIPAEVCRDTVPEPVQRLFGLGLGLHRAPWRLRSDSFRTRIRRGPPDDRSEMTKRHLALAVPSPPRPGTAGADAGWQAPNSEARTVDAKPADSPAEARGGGPASGAGALESPRIEGPGRKPDEGDQKVWSGVSTGDTTTVATEDATYPRSPNRSRPVAEEIPAAVNAERGAAASQLADDADFLAGGTFTRLGGLLYLIHPLLDLELLQVFEKGWSPSTTVGPWAILGLIGRGLLSHRFPAIAEDPLWRMLDNLANGEKPDSLSASRAEYRVPPGWAAKLSDPGDLFCWSVARGRLRLWSEAGYLIAEVSRTTARPSLQARLELERYLAGVRGCRAGQGPRLARRAHGRAPLADMASTSAGYPPELEQLAAAVVPAVRRRLLLALGENPEGADLTSGAAGDPVDRLVMVPATLHLTSSHLDLVFDLDDADVTVRSAGLDRNPGWLPDLGRVLTFHFR